MPAQLSLQPVDAADLAPDERPETRTDLMFVDLHTHSHYSDGLPSVSQIEEHCLRSGIGVALTDHNQIRGSVILSQREKFPCLPGIEVGTREGLEFLVYFPDAGRLEDYFMRAVEPYLLSRFLVRSHIPTMECLDIARDMGAYVSLAHPFAFGRKSLDYQQRSRKTHETFVDEVVARVGAIELFNGGVPAKVNRRAATYLDEIDKPITVGSDSHRLKTYGSCGVYLRGERPTGSGPLFDMLSGNSIHTTEQSLGSIALTLPIIMIKHTLFFIAAGNHPWRRQR